ncbi:hypothetical protein SCARD494_03175 [Seiridium cardinale]
MGSQQPPHRMLNGNHVGQTCCYDGCSRTVLGGGNLCITHSKPGSMITGTAPQTSSPMLNNTSASSRNPQRASETGFYPYGFVGNPSGDGTYHTAYNSLPMQQMPSLKGLQPQQPPSKPGKTLSTKKTARKSVKSPRKANTADTSGQGRPEAGTISSASSYSENSGPAFPTELPPIQQGLSCNNNPLHLSNVLAPIIDGHGTFGSGTPPPPRNVESSFYLRPGSDKSTQAQNGVTHQADTIRHNANPKPSANSPGVGTISLSQYIQATGGNGTISQRNGNISGSQENANGVNQHLGNRPTVQQYIHERTIDSSHSANGIHPHPYSPQDFSERSIQQQLLTEEDLHRQMAGQREPPLQSQMAYFQQSRSAHLSRSNSDFPTRSAAQSVNNGQSPSTDPPNGPLIPEPRSEQLQPKWGQSFAPRQTEYLPANANANANVNTSISTSTNRASPFHNTSFLPDHILVRSHPSPTMDLSSYTAPDLPSNPDPARAKWSKDREPKTAITKNRPTDFLSKDGPSRKRSSKLGQQPPWLNRAAVSATSDIIDLTLDDDDNIRPSNIPRRTNEFVTSALHSNHIATSPNPPPTHHGPTHGNFGQRSLFIQHQRAYTTQNSPPEVSSRGNGVPPRHSKANQVDVADAAIHNQSLAHMSGDARQQQERPDVRNHSRVGVSKQDAGYSRQPPNNGSRERARGLATQSILPTPEPEKSTPVGYFDSRQEDELESSPAMQDATMTKSTTAVSQLSTGAQKCEPEISSKQSNAVARQLEDITTEERRLAFKLTAFSPHGEAVLDSYVYGPGNAQNRPGLPPRYLMSSKAPSEEDFLREQYAHIDPRMHWSWEREPSWHMEQMKKADAAGNRKSAERFGNAKAGVKARIAGNKTKTVEPPERVRRRPDWLSGLEQLDQIAAEYRAEQDATSQRKRKAHYNDDDTDEIMIDA